MHTAQLALRVAVRLALGFTPRVEPVVREQASLNAQRARTVLVV